MSARRIAILGASGVIGRKTAALVAASEGSLQCPAIAVGSSAETAIQLAKRLQPHLVAVADAAAAGRVREALAGTPCVVLAGEEGLVAVASYPDVDTVVSAIGGAAGLVPTLAAIRSGKRVALANKETLVAAGPLAMRLARAHGATVIPIDSEHSALFQVLQGLPLDQVEKLILTASGGPFRGWRADALKEVTPALALAHPTWNMGRRITVDSATLFNKGLEVIEARWLFGVEYNRIDVVVHPESIVHSLVETTDGSLLAQLGPTAMEVPIQYALSWPERWPNPVQRLSLVDVGALTFFAPDRATFPCLDLAYAAGRAGGTAPAVLNAADEIAVALFLAGRLPFHHIPLLLESVLAQHQVVPEPDLDVILEADAWAREAAGSLIAKYGTASR